MEMKKYQEPQMNIYNLEDEDIITTSDGLWDIKDNSVGGDGLTSDGMGWSEF